MSRNIFLSFLGISQYEPVRYYMGENGKNLEYKVEKFVQKTLLDHLSSFFTEDDIAVIFLTDSARRNNWEAKEGDQRLEPQISNAYRFQVVGKPVRDESSTESIWDTFMTMFDSLQDGDTVYMDITHSWRYLPMLGSTLLNYAKALKSIQVGAIYYGAFERLGSITEVRQMPLEERWAPVLNLASFSELQEWSLAARDFVDYGNPIRWSALTKQAIDPVLKATGGSNQEMKALQQISKRIQEMVPLITTNRGKALYEFDFVKLDELLQRFSSEQNSIKPLNPILQLVKTKVTPFSQAATLGWMEAVKWCIDHQLIQQGFTHLQEGLLTWLCIYFKHLNIYPDFFDWKKEDPRALLSSALNIIHKKIPDDQWTGSIGRNKLIGQKIVQFPLLLKLASVYQVLSDTRNDISHGGYTRDMKASGFSQKLEEFYRKIRELLEPEVVVFEREPTHFLNISNHPSSNWSTDQLSTALEQFGTLEDMAFPVIPPDWTEAQIIEMADIFLERIIRKRPAAVHLMGEMTFTYTLAQKLKNAGIPCVASTTVREVIDHGDGRKEAQFRFVRFRPYF